MAELLESIDKAKAIAAELIELLHIPSDTRYEKFFHSRNYTLRYEYSGTGVKHQDVQLRLTKKPKTSNPPPREGAYAASMMGVTKSFTDGSFTFAGHGDVDEVVTALEELRDLYTKVVGPIKEIIKKLSPESVCVKFVLRFDAGDAMFCIDKWADKYVMSVYRGTISPHPSNVFVKITFDNDLNVAPPIKVDGPLDKVYRTIGLVLEDVQKGTIRFIKQEINDA